MTVTAMKVKYIYRTFVDVTFVSRFLFYLIDKWQKLVVYKDTC